MIERQNNFHIVSERNKGWNSSSWCKLLPRSLKELKTNESLLISLHEGEW